MASSERLIRTWRANLRGLPATTPGIRPLRGLAQAVGTRLQSCGHRGLKRHLRAVQRHVTEVSGQALNSVVVSVLQGHVVRAIVQAWRLTTGREWRYEEREEAIHLVSTR